MAIQLDQLDGHPRLLMEASLEPRAGNAVPAHRIPRPGGRCIRHSRREWQLNANGVGGVGPIRGQ